ncbi:MAG: CvpA family protein [Lachnospiraceae bacterium]|nr:CvpA family protein [Lachnospiraceae bacterium]
MNILEIAVVILIAVFAIAGWRKGFVRKLASMLSFVISIILVAVFLPYMTEFLKTETPVYDYIVKQCREVMAENLADAITMGNVDVQSGTWGGSDSLKMANAISDYSDISREQIKSLMEQYGYDSAVVDALSDEQLEAYKEKYAQQYIQQYFGAEEGGVQGSGTGQLTKIEQTELIEHLPIPEALRDLLLDYNNDEGYRSLGVTGFADYLVHFLATVILNVIAFVAAVILVQILLHLVIGALDILAHIPLIGGLNRLLGLILGLVQALFFLWLFFLILSMTSATQWGLQLMDMVQSSQTLSALYDSNLFLEIVVRTVAMFV